jgi:hypothetical protein
MLLPGIQVEKLKILPTNKSVVRPLAITRLSKYNSILKLFLTTVSSNQYRNSLNLFRDSRPYTD